MINAQQVQLTFAERCPIGGFLHFGVGQCGLTLTPQALPIEEIKLRLPRHEAPVLRDILVKLDGGQWISHFSEIKTDEDQALTLRLNMSSQGQIEHIRLSNSSARRSGRNYDLRVEYYAGGLLQGSYVNSASTPAMQRFSAFTDTFFSKQSPLERAGLANGFTEHLHAMREYANSPESADESTYGSLAEVKAPLLEALIQTSTAPGLPSDTTISSIKLLDFLIRKAGFDFDPSRTPDALDEKAAALICALYLKEAWFLGLDHVWEYQRFFASDVQRFEAAVRQWFEHLTGRSGDEVFFTRHGMKRNMYAGSEKICAGVLHEIVTLLNANRRNVALAYGTLLGAVREGGFLPHDDDMDVIVDLGEVADDEVPTRMEEIAQIVEKGSFAVKRVDPFLFMSARHKETGFSVDLFPSWTHNGEAKLYMEQLKIRQVPHGLVFPTKDAEFYGYNVPVPLNAERFLTERYGNSWQVPDPYFEFEMLMR